MTVETQLPAGYTTLPAGMLANVVTCLQMLAKPVLRPVHGGGAGFSLTSLPRHDLQTYRARFRQVGAEWLWYSRLAMADEQLSAILSHPDVEALTLLVDGKPSGLLELDCREEGQCELAFFGVTKEAIGTSAGRYLMNEAITRAWARPIARLWVHTSTLDHPAALAFYIRSGFTPYQRMIEIHHDPRLNGLLPRTAAPQVPLIEFS